MSLFIESIRVIDGRIIRPEFHWQRIEWTLNAHRMDLGLVYFFRHFENVELPEHGLYKWRFVYGQEGILQQSMLPYSRRKIERIKVVEDDEMNYPWKSLDRDRIEGHFTDRGDADDILIAKNGYLTDTSYANILLWDGELWWTPETPLLPGTQRAFLLQQGSIMKKPIRLDEIFHYKKIRLINAMMPFNEAPELLIDQNSIV